MTFFDVRLSMFDVNHNRWGYLAIAESRQVVEVQGRLVEPRTILKVRCFVVAGKGSEAEGKLPRIGVASKEGQAVSQVEIAGIVDAGAVGFARVENGLQKLGYLADIGWRSTAADCEQM
jgi:hypothetical protein